MPQKIFDQLSETLNRPKIRKFFLRVLLPVVILGSILFIVLAPPRFSMGDGYLFCLANKSRGTSSILDPGGRTILGPADIRLWGNYPWVYGTSDDPSAARFILDMEEHTLRRFPEKTDSAYGPDEFERFLYEHKFSMAEPVSWNELYTGSKERRLRLRSLLGKRKIK